MEKKIIVAGKEYNAKATALLPRLYRYKFGRDILVDINKLHEAAKGTEDGKGFTITDLTIFEDVCWLFLRCGGEDVGDSPDEWLDSIDGVFSVYEALPQILDLWEANLKQTSHSKKK